jgi:hypothetical protein
MRLEDLHPDSRALVQEIIDTEDVQFVQVSCYSEEGVMEVKNKACDALLAHRVDSKLKGSKINSVINRIHVAQPKARDDVVRAPFIPEAIKERKKYDKNDPERRRLQRDVELEEGGAGVFNINMRRQSFLHSIQNFTTELFSQRITCSPTPNGRWILFPRLWTGRISPISSTPTLPRSSMPSSGKKKNSKRKGSTTASQI